MDETDVMGKSIKILLRIYSAPTIHLSLEMTGLNSVLKTLANSDDFTPS
jgi:hypothetical protein